MNSHLMIDIDQVFSSAVNNIEKDKLKLSPDTQLIFYGLYQQAMYGDNNKSRPLCCYSEKTVKYEAWLRFKNMSKYDAKILYINTYQMIYGENSKLNKLSII